ncbi:MAG TPA: YMGG-like glycine zipper-containing protein, partial [Blastocatellia bacterium]|nr:YMGG-like glycine zipper-containing protein [Blastocatellia bacterium]
LVINASGDRGSDFQVTFGPVNRGREMRVIRQVYVDRLTQPVIVTSVYDRTSDVAQMNIYNGNQVGWNNNNNGSMAGSLRRNFYIPNNTELVATLNNDLSTKTAQAGDRFTMTIQSPSQYAGAVIEGSLGNVDRSGRVAGRAELAMNFERIRMRNGQTYEFAGYIENVRTPNGENIRVDNEGTVKEENSQTEQTVKRAGIGAALGAVIGAIAGGGKGAAIGAAVGAGAGAGSVIIQGRDDLDLRSGSELTIRASAPNN